MKLQCPKCHSFVFDRFRAMEAVVVLAELWAFYKIVSNSLVKVYMVPVVILGLIALEYAIRYVYIAVQNKHNKNIY